MGYDFREGGSLMMDLQENQPLEKMTDAANTPPKRMKLRFLFIPLLIVLLLAVVIAGLFIPVYKSAKDLVGTSQKLTASVKAQDLPSLEAQIPAEKASLAKLKDSLKLVSWLQFAPIAGQYISDANHGVTAAEALLDAGDLSVKAIAPYADIIGLTGNKKATTGQEKAQDRIAFIVSTVDKIAPQMDAIGQKLLIAQKELDQINPGRYPEEFQGKPLRSSLEKGISAVDEATLILSNAKPVLEVAPWLLGNDKKRTYLVLFQNDAELRPTGGFWTGYALISVEKGKLTPIFSGDIYDLDARYAGGLRAPKPLIDFIADPYKKEQLAGKAPQWRLRDMNLSPDFRASVETFLPQYLKAGGPKVDGVIGIDSKVLVGLLKVLGPVGVPGFGNFSAENDPRCNCPQVIYQLESIIGVVTPYMRENRKGVIGPLMHSVLANAIGSPKDKLPALFQSGFNNVLNKDVLFYFPDATVQKAVESFNLAGRVRESTGDYLFVVDSNMAGAKTNLYVQDEVTDVVELKSGSAVHNLTVSYKNTQKDDQWLNGLYRDWFRIYVPKGSKLTANSGSELPVTTSEDLGKTVFSGFFTLRPLGITKLTFSYEAPITSFNPYIYLIQKQGGTVGYKYSVTVKGRKTDFILLQDKELRYSN